jgi:hypothetical protein
MHTCHRAWASPLSAPDRTRLDRRHAPIHSRRLPIHVPCLVVDFRLVVSLSACQVLRTWCSALGRRAASAATSGGIPKMREKMSSKTILAKRPGLFIPHFPSPSSQTSTPKVLMAEPREAAKHVVASMKYTRSCPTACGSRLVVSDHVDTDTSRVSAADNSPRLNSAECLACLRWQRERPREAGRYVRERRAQHERWRPRWSRRSPRSLQQS